MANKILNRAPHSKWQLIPYEPLKGENPTWNISKCGVFCQGIGSFTQEGENGLKTMDFVYLLDMLWTVRPVGFMVHKFDNPKFMLIH